MKFTAFALIASLCLVAVSANAVGSFEKNYEDVQLYEYIAQDFADEIMEIDPEGIFTGTWILIIKILKTIKRTHCAVSEIYKIAEAGHTFVVDIAKCGGEVNKKVQELINAVNDIIDTGKEIGEVPAKYCKNIQDEKTSRGVVSSVKLGHKCAAKMFLKLAKISRQIHHALRLIYDIRKVPGNTSKCALDAIDKLATVLDNFPPNLEACSKLTK